MTESERQLQAMALSIQAARQQAGCKVPVAAPPAAADAIPNLGGEARSGDCLVSMLASGSKDMQPISVVERQISSSMPASAAAVSNRVEAL